MSPLAMLEKRAKRASKSTPSVPRWDFPVRVDTRFWEANPTLEHQFAGIHSVTLAHTIPVMFVPLFERPTTSWGSRLMDDLDAIRTTEDARTASVLLSGYTVTPNDSLAGQTEVVYLSDGDQMHRTVIFYTTMEDFEVFSFEMNEVARLSSGTQGWTAVSALLRCRFGRFLLSQVVASPHFLPEDRRLLEG